MLDLLFVDDEELDFIIEDDFISEVYLYGIFENEIIFIDYVFILKENDEFLLIIVYLFD